MELGYENPIIGNSLNPRDSNRSSGWSSAGEGGIIACKLAPIGVGTDWFGSIRIPASFCGVYGFKPTSYRSL